MKPALKPHGTERLNLKRDLLLSTSAFKFNLRRFSKWLTPFPSAIVALGFYGISEAGAHTRPLFSST